MKTEPPDRETEETAPRCYDRHAADIDRRSWLALRRSDETEFKAWLVESVRVDSDLIAIRPEITDFSIVLSDISLSEAHWWLDFVAEENEICCAMRYLAFDSGMWRDKTAETGCRVKNIEILSEDKPWTMPEEKERPFVLELELEADSDAIAYAYIDDIDIEAFQARHNREGAANGFM